MRKYLFLDKTEKELIKYRLELLFLILALFPLFKRRKVLRTVMKKLNKHDLRRKIVYHEN